MSHNRSWQARWLQGNGYNRPYPLCFSDFFRTTPNLLEESRLCAIWPAWIFEYKGTRDKEPAELDLDAYWNEVINDAMEDLAYPLVHVPDELEGIDRIIWRLRSYDWWEVKAWGLVVAVKRFFNYGPGMQPRLRLDPYNKHAMRWNEVINDAMDDLIYPLVHVPSDLKGVDRIV